MTGSESVVALASFLARVTEACRDAFALYIAERGPDLRFQRHALLAVATLEGCVAHPELEQADILLMRDAADDAAAVCRTEEPSVEAKAIVALLEEVVLVCDEVLGETNEHAQGWQRFLFADSDVQVRRDGRLWRVRTPGAEIERKLLDVALDEVLVMTSQRIGELTVQILGWYALHASARDS